MSGPARPPLFDPVALWDSLDPVTRRSVGIAATAAVAALMYAEIEPDGVGATAAIHHTAEVVIERLFDHLPTPLPRLDLAKIGIRACEVCGCTDAVGCEGGCTWIDERRCSRCPP